MKRIFNQLLILFYYVPYFFRIEMSSMIILKSLKVILMLRVVVMGVPENIESVKEHTQDYFGPLCDVMRAMSGVWQSVTGPEEYSTEDIKKLDETVGRSLFGSKWSEGRTGDWHLPENFSGLNPNRKDVCGSKKKNTDMPTASESMASAILCLCTPANTEKKLCEIQVNGNGKWQLGGKQEVKVVFEHIWGQWSGDGIMTECGSPSMDISFEAAKKNFNEKLEKLKSILANKSDTLHPTATKCDGSNPCAHVTENPDWLKKLKELANINLTPAPPPPQLARKETHEPPSSSTTVPVTGPPATTTPEPVTSQVPEETSQPSRLRSPEEEAKKVPLTQPGPGKTPAEVPEDKEEKKEDHVPVPGNETSSTLINGPKWPLLAALLI
ncbi:Variant surface glycoprotein [Trypanosoma congolense IL3000]|uniref:Variant surface glycoprotein n=1 Tax=Trypanosoma congolense (strain IL3000) TaxID=1068625 RepID=F9W581_TRYCI|nr:Variant surface glycoprotein [Trypanosoma congolense IL3000]